MARKELPPCYEIARACDVLAIALRALYEASNIALFDVEDFDMVVWALSRKLLSEQFGEPVLEGLKCWGEDEDTCYGYRMIFKCRDDGGKAFEIVDVDFDYDSGLTLNYFAKIKIESIDVEDLKPRKIVMNIEQVEDEKIKKIVEAIRKDSGVEE